MVTKKVTVNVAGRRLQVSNLDKVLYPAVGFRKRDVIGYYQRAAFAILPHLRNRAATLVRCPDGVDTGAFFQKDVARYAPAWLPTVRLASGATGGGSEVNSHVVFDDLPALVWAANLAALELHVPQWMVDAEGQRCTPDLAVFDLDPGPPATIVECARLAERLGDVLISDGLRPFVKTSGSKGIQLYCAVYTDALDRTSEYAREIAERMAEEEPGRVVSKMSKSVRGGKVLIDWSQNNPAKTTIAPYSLRGHDHPTVSTPVRWQEIHDCRNPKDLMFDVDTVLERLDAFGDLFADLHRDPVSVPAGRG